MKIQRELHGQVLSLKSLKRLAAIGLHAHNGYTILWSSPPLWTCRRIAGIKCSSGIRRCLKTISCCSYFTSLEGVIICEANSLYLVATSNEDNNMMEYHRASDMNELWQRLTLQAVSAPENDLISENAAFGCHGEHASASSKFKQKQV